MFSKIYDKVKNYIKYNYKFLLSIIIIIFLFYYEFPYVIYRTGGTINLADRVKIDKKYTQKGSLSMSYVTTMKGTIPFMALSYILPDWDLKPLKEVTNESNYDEEIKKAKVNLNEGIDNAIISAFNESDYSITINKTIINVVAIGKKAKTDIEIGDQIVGVEGEVIDSPEVLKNIINSFKEGDTINIEVINNQKEYKRKAKIYLESDNTLKIGVAYKTSYEYETEIPISLKMKNNESGSSGGLMMSLAIYNALTKEDITKGLNIVGTGSIDSLGNVQEIGGVKYKILAAEKAKADIFFCPKENYKEALKIKKKRKLKLEVVSVKTLKDAIDYLNNK